jgi:dCTP diphosphatase
VSEAARSLRLHHVGAGAEAGDHTEDGRTRPDGDSLAVLAGRLREFRDRRDWRQFHTPLNLAVSISIETGELLEQFQWSDPDGSQLEARREAIAEEMADVAIYVIQLADVLDIPLGEAIDSKIDLNERRYPASEARGSSRKYTQLHDVDPVSDRH